MSEAPDLRPTQKRALIQLAFLPDAMVSKLADLKPDLDAKLRKDLVSRRFLKVLPTSKGQRGTSVALDDGGWRWVMENLNVDLPEKEQVAGVLMSVLRKLAEFLKTNNLDIQDVIQARHVCRVENAPSSSAEAPQFRTHSPLTDEQFIGLAEQMGGAETQVRLRDLRKQLTDYTSDEVDSVIRKLHGDGTLSVIPIDLPTDIDEFDVAASIDIGGRSRHAVIVRRR